MQSLLSSRPCLTPYAFPNQCPLPLQMSCCLGPSRCRLTLIPRKQSDLGSLNLRPRAVTWKTGIMRSPTVAGSGSITLLPKEFLHGFPHSPSEMVCNTCTVATTHAAEVGEVAVGQGLKTMQSSSAKSTFGNGRQQTQTGAPRFFAVRCSCMLDVPSHSIIHALTLFVEFEI